MLPPFLWISSLDLYMKHYCLGLYLSEKKAYSNLESDAYYTVLFYFIYFKQY